MSELFKKLPMMLTALFLLMMDQLTKILVVYLIPEGTKGWSFGGDFFWLIHQRNPGAAFSLGVNLPDWTRILIFVIITAIALIILGTYLVKERSQGTLSRWGLWLILAGGTGNLIDRIFRFPDGVVDFLSFKIYGLFGWSRFPSFNLADMAVTAGGILIILTFIFSGKKKELPQHE